MVVHSQSPIVVFQLGSPNKMQRHSWLLSLIQICMLFYLVALVLLSMVAKPFSMRRKKQSNSYKSYHGEQKIGYVPPPEKVWNVYHKQVSKMALHFVWGHLPIQQTVTATHYLIGSMNRLWMEDYSAVEYKWCMKEASHQMLKVPKVNV